MNILAFDTTLNHCSVAVMTDSCIVAHCSERLQRGHAEALMPMIQSALSTARLSFDDLDLVGVTTGPGTFTGQRVGLSAARGIGVSRQLPVQGVGTLPAIAAAVRKDHAEVDILVVMDARRDEFYVQHFPAAATLWANQLPARAIATDRLAETLPGTPCLLVGTGVELATGILGNGNPKITFGPSGIEADAVEVADLAALIVVADGLPHTPPSPLYLRAPDAKLPGGKSL
jgi:tRNA threonylcarbamoyladenosine biosynthesis protein TsaB